MLHALFAGLCVTVSLAHERGESHNGGQARLVQHAGCYIDADCGNNEVCNNGECDDADTICYGDDECRDRQVCDMGAYICVDPTLSPVTTDAPGCCMGDSYKANDKCSKATDRSRCEDMGCTFLETDEPSDCALTTTSSSTTTSEVGCCYGEGVKENAMCGSKDSESQCVRSNSCEWRRGDSADCTFTPTTTTAEVGCCKGANYKSNAKCNGASSRDRCEDMGCEFIETTDFDDCTMTTTTSSTSTTTTEEPGCCYSESYKSNAKCNKAADQGRCESNGCDWRVTDDASECEMTTTTTTTTTEMPGCCMGDSSKTNAMCNVRDTKTQCEKSSSCHFVENGDVATDCAIVATTSEPGCCYLNPAQTYSAKYQETCTGFYTERDCLKLTDGAGETRCVFAELIEGYDCSLLWPTTTTTTMAPGCCMGDSYKAQEKCVGLSDQIGCERKDCAWIETDDASDCLLTTTDTPTTTEEPGCCKGDSSKANPMCNARETRTKCEKSSSCHFVAGGDVDSDCVVEETTIEAGCCYGNPDAAYSKKWMESCTAFYTARDCLQMTDSDGAARCAWEPLGEYMDCEMLWPTTTTTTEEPGCCKGSSYKAQAKCWGLADEMGCTRKGCEWVPTYDLSDCIITTSTTTSTTTTEEPGCCKGDSAHTNERCNKMEARNLCERSSSCHFISGGFVDVDCVVAETTTEEPGCCYGNPDAAYSKKWMESCTAFYTARDCLLLTNGDGEDRCAWEEIGEGYDCAQLWPTTTSTTEEAGCCRGYSFKAQAKCAGLADSIGCARKDCEWVVGGDADTDCVLTTTTTTSTTTTEEPGCCKADNVQHQGLCDMKETESKCARSSSCHWMVGDEPSLCEHPQTEVPEEPGCCYGNPESAYSKRWMESCTAFYTVRDCELLENGDGEARCVWEELGDGYDCSQLWPTTTTTTTEPGCCYGDNAAANSMCAAFDDDAAMCDGRSQCVFRSGADADCIFTPTTTTAEVGCCKGTTRKSAEMCVEKDGREQCDRSAKCEFVVTNDDSDCEFPTTTSEPWLNAKSEAAKHSVHVKGKKHAKGANAQEAKLFGSDIDESTSTMGQAMQYEVSLSTLLLFVVAALALHQAYRCVANRNGDYKKIDAVGARATYQTV